MRAQNRQTVPTVSGLAFGGSPSSGVICTMNKIRGPGIKVLSMYPISTSSYGVTFITSLGFSLFTGRENSLVGCLGARID